MLAHRAGPRAEDGSTDCQFFYFDQSPLEKKWEWRPLDRFKAPPHLAGLINVDGNLYAVGGQDTSMISTCDVFKYDFEQNLWTELPSMTVPREVSRSFPLVHLDGFIYVIGGYDEYFEFLQDGERFDLARQEWQELPSFPEGFQFEELSTMSFNGKILVYGGVVEDSEAVDILSYVLLVYDPNTNIWHTALTEDRVSNVTLEGPVIFVYKETLYRVMYKRHSDDSVELEDILLEPTVHMLKMQSLRNTVRVSVMEEISQEHVPVNTAGAFRIQDDVFVNLEGFIHKTNIKINQDQMADVDLRMWRKTKSMESYFEHSNVTNFTFDLKKFTK